MASAFGPYWAVVSARFRMLLQYRAAAFAGFVTQLFWGAIRLMILAAFYAGATTAPPMSFPQIAAYVWLGQALLGLLPWNIDNDLGTQIRTGGVAYELLRPLNLYTYWFMRTLAFRCAGTTLRMLPLLAFAMVVLPLLDLGRWSLPPPASLLSAVLFMLSLICTVLLSTAITMIMHVGLLWTIAGDGFNRTMPGVVSVLSGMTIPLPLFPDWLQPVLYWQPFRGLADVPYRIYGGHIAASDALLEILLQLGWAALLAAAGAALLTRGTRALVLQGG